MSTEATAASSSAANTYRVHTQLDGLAMTLVIMLCLTWGLNQISIKVANHGLQPVFQSGLRFAIGSVIVFGWCVFRRVRLFDRDGTLPGGVIAGILFGVEFAMMAIALEYTTAARGVIFIYTMPFFVAIGAHLFVPGERMTAAGFLGLVLAFSGVVIVFFDDASVPGPMAIWGDILSVIAGLLWAATTIVIKTTPLKSAAPEKVLLYQLVVAGIVLLPVAPAFGPLIREITPAVVAAFTFQILLVVSVTFLVWFWLIRHYPAARLTSFTFLTPVFGVLFGGLLLGEPIGLRLPIALVLVALGIYLVNRPATAPPVAPVPKP